MLPDAECVKIVNEILTSVNVGKFVIKVNHRMILNGIFEVIICVVAKINGLVDYGLKDN